jgi:porin
MDFKPRKLGLAVALLLFFSLPNRADELAPPGFETHSLAARSDESPAVRLTTISDVHRTSAIRVASQPPRPADDEPVPGRPSRPGDEMSEVLPRADAAGNTDPADDSPEEDGEDEDEADELMTLLGEPWHQFGSVSAEYFYTGEVFNNTRGGLSTKGATRYRGNFDLVLRLDTERANWWENGEVYVYMQQSQGTTLTPEFVGDGQFYSNIDTSPKPQYLTQLGEYWYQHAFGEDVLSVRIGRQDPNTDFAYADLGGDFVNSSFITLPNIPMPYWPFQTLGVSSLYQPHEKLRLGGGVYDQGRDQEQWWVTTTSRGMFFIAQADYLPFADCDDAPLTIFRGGTWYSSSDTEAIDASHSFPDNYGFYVTIDRMLFSETKSADQGLGAFFQFSWAPPDRNMVDRGIGTGLVYCGLLPGRDEDTCGGGFSLIEFSSDLRATTGQTYENAIEVFYKARIRDWLAIAPDLQYIARPSGIERDAMVVGLRFEVNF